MRWSCLAAIGVLAAAAISEAQENAWRFRFETGQTWTYRIDHKTKVSEVIGGSKVQTSSKLNLLKQWKILKVDSKGTATIQMSLAAMRNEQVLPNGKTLVFESDSPEDSSPGMREHLMKYINKPLAELQVSPRGEVLAAKLGDVTRFQAELPFHCILPSSAAGQGQTWQRKYQITLNPPLGTGEKYNAVQHYRCAEVAGNRARIALSTEIMNLPESPLDQVPLIQKQPAGELTYDVKTGRLQSATIRIERHLKDHQGKGSSYHFETDYKEQLVVD